MNGQCDSADSPYSSPSSFTPSLPTSLPAVWLDPQEAAEIGQANSRSGVRKLLKDGHM